MRPGSRGSSPGARARRSPGALGALRAIAEARPGSSCEFCGESLPAKHEHLLGLPRRELRCVCGTCAGLFQDADGAGADGADADAPRWARIAPRRERLGEEGLAEATWESLGIPIGLALVVRRGSGEARVLYPGPAGVMEADLAEDAEEALRSEIPAVARLAPEVEALLVRRLGAAQGTYRVSIDEAFRLAGLLRRSWRGLAGGEEAFRAIDGFFAELDADAGPVRGDPEALRDA